MKRLWKSWDYIYKKAHSKKIVFFGRSDDWLEKNYIKLKGNIYCIVDNNPSLHGSTYKNLNIYKPSDILPAKDIFVVITSGSYTGIYEQLLKLGLTPGDDFCCTPYINDLAFLDEIQNHSAKLLVTIPDHHNKRTKDNNTGGMYLYELNGELKKLVSGLFRQICRGDNGCYYAIEHYRGICIIDDDFKIIKEQSLETNAQPHGVAFDSGHNLVFAANTGLDKVTIHDATTLKKVDEITFSYKLSKDDIEQHHINDLHINEGSLYVCYFSKSGNYRRGVFDGGIDQYNLKALTEGAVPVTKNLWFPHSVKVINGNICYLDTMRGDLYIQSNEVASHFPGFMRGMDHDGKYYFIGQSINTYISRLKGISNHIMLNAGIYIYDYDHKCSIFHPIAGVTDIHEILIL